MYRSILVPLDGSTRAEAILPHVYELAKRYTARVIFIQVVETPILMLAPNQPDMVLYKNEVDRRTREAEEYLKSMQKQCQKKGLDAAFEIGWGPVVESIIKAAEIHDVDLIALASHGRSGLARVFYGSVAAGILQRAERPLLLIRSQS